jgi:hypothetical protein
MAGGLGRPGTNRALQAVTLTSVIDICMAPPEQAVGRIGARWLVHSSRLYIKPDLFGTGPHSLLVP